MRIERDMSVELARILACLIVIGVHSCLAVYRENYYDLNRVFISCLFADGVAVFWLIMGGFLFENLDYKRLFQKTLRSVGIPMIGITVFTFYLSGWAIDGMPLLQSISHTKEDYIYISIASGLGASGVCWVFVVLVHILYGDIMFSDIEKFCRIFGWK